VERVAEEEMAVEGAMERTEAADPGFLGLTHMVPETADAGGQAAMVVSVVRVVPGDREEQLRLQTR